MKFFLDKDEIEEISPIPLSDDKAIVILDQTGKREEGVSEIQKEIVALDAIELGPSAASRIHGVPESSASKYKDGKDLERNPDAKTRILATKYDIADLATAKLMQTLNLIEPDDLISTKNKVMVLNSLSNLVDKVSDKSGNNGNGAVHLHLYAPQQKKESDYDTIDV